ncbi:tetratricopeptide repeat-containing sensor histidine kinase [Flavobacterium limnophilum]|uniref:tetratricopeptide repeat-containing sensor histidine kinase n=1 Tax=Flavobacterium limnophilum TaxID=3003262 RepID=UPI002482CFD1|nr:ATP-binding protein [Flavobacterium limnophilum]
MIFKKFHFPIFVLLAVFFALQSCEKKPKKKPEKKSNLVEINRLILLGEKHFTNTKYDSSYYYFSKAKSLCDVKKDTAKIIYSILELAYIEQNQGNYSGCETTILEAFPYLKNNPKPNHHWALYNIMGHNYLQTLDYKLALHYYNLALHFKTNQFRKACIKNNIAVVHMDTQDYPNAIQILLPLTSEKEIKNKPEEFCKILDNLGYSYFKVGNPKGIGYMKQSLLIRKQIKDDWGLVRTYIHLNEYYQKNNPKLANEYAQSAYEKATKVNNADDRLESLKLLIKNSHRNQLKKYSLDYIRINDSLVKARQKAKNQFAKIKYDSKLDKEENLRLKTQKAETALELEKQKNQNLVLNFLVITGILSTIFLYYFLKAINKKEKIQTSYDTETRISKKLHDELANDVYHTLAFAETQNLSTSQNKESLLNNLDNIYSRIRNISKENSIVDTGIKYVEGLKEMMSGFNTCTITILVNGMHSIDWNALENNKKIIVYRVIQELLVNMKKHSQCSLAIITFKKSENKLQIDYSDNGVGAALDKINSRNGLQNVENRILSINGTITFDTKSDKGFKTSFTIPA